MIDKKLHKTAGGSFAVAFFVDESNVPTENGLMFVFPTEEHAKEVVEWINKHMPADLMTGDEISGYIRQIIVESGGVDLSKYFVVNAMVMKVTTGTGAKQ